MALLVTIVRSVVITVEVAEEAEEEELTISAVEEIITTHVNLISLDLLRTITINLRGKIVGVEVEATFMIVHVI